MVVAQYLWGACAKTGDWRAVLMQVVVLPRPPPPLGSEGLTSRLVENGQLTVKSNQGLCYELTGQFNKKRQYCFICFRLSQDVITITIITM